MVFPRIQSLFGCPGALLIVDVYSSAVFVRDQGMPIYFSQYPETMGTVPKDEHSLVHLDKS